MDAADVTRELTELRRGRGLDAVDLHTRVGPSIRRLCGIDPDESPVVVRRKLILSLRRSVDRLPPDLRLAAEVALALHNEAPGQFLDSRIAWLAAHFDRDQRTARRRIDEAFRMLARTLVEEPTDERRQVDSASHRWRVLEMRAFLRCDLDPPTLLDERRIVATVDELDELLLAMSAPRRTGSEMGSIEVRAHYGGEIVERSEVSPSHIRFVLRLPRPLRLGQHHQYGVEVVGRPKNDMCPHYVLAPFHRTDHLQIRARFDRSCTPPRLWRVAAAPPRVLDDAQPSGESVELDEIGEVLLDFYDLRQGLNYGLQWQWPDA